jgi:riboflavin synthase alpha subunit
VFTGIIRELGRVAELDGSADGVRLTLEAPATAALTAQGDSVALDGVCLTAVTVADGHISFEAVPETLRRTTLARLTQGDHVNVEPALRAGDPLGGHYVQGHVDAVGRVRSVDEEGDGARIWIDAPAAVQAFCVE